MISDTTWILSVCKKLRLRMHPTICVSTQSIFLSFSVVIALVSLP